MIAKLFHEVMKMTVRLLNVRDIFRKGEGQKFVRFSFFGVTAYVRIDESSYLPFCPENVIHAHLFFLRFSRSRVLPGFAPVRA